MFLRYRWRIGSGLCVVISFFSVGAISTRASPSPASSASGPGSNGSDPDSGSNAIALSKEIGIEPFWKQRKERPKPPKGLIFREGLHGDHIRNTIGEWNAVKGGSRDIQGSEFELFAHTSNEDRYMSHRLVNHNAYEGPVVRDFQRSLRCITKHDPRTKFVVNKKDGKVVNTISPTAESDINKLLNGSLGDVDTDPSSDASLCEGIGGVVNSDALSDSEKQKSSSKSVVCTHTSPHNGSQDEGKKSCKGNVEVFSKEAGAVDSSKAADPAPATSGGWFSSIITSVVDTVTGKQANKETKGKEKGTLVSPNDGETQKDRKGRSDVISMNSDGTAVPDNDATTPEYDPKQVEVINRPLLFDVGANIGFYSFTALKFLERWNQKQEHKPHAKQKELTKTRSGDNHTRDDANRDPARTHRAHNNHNAGYSESEPAVFSFEGMPYNSLFVEASRNTFFSNSTREMRIVEALVTKDADGRKEKPKRYLIDGRDNKVFEDDAELDGSLAVQGGDSSDSNQFSYNSSNTKTCPYLCVSSGGSSDNVVELVSWANGEITSLKKCIELWREGTYALLSALNATDYQLNMNLWFPGYNTTVMPRFRRMLQNHYKFFKRIVALQREEKRRDAQFQQAQIGGVRKTGTTLKEWRKGSGLVLRSITGQPDIVGDNSDLYSDLYCKLALVIKKLRKALFGFEAFVRKYVRPSKILTGRQFKIRAVQSHTWLVPMITLDSAAGYSTSSYTTPVKNARSSSSSLRTAEGYTTSSSTPPRTAEGYTTSSSSLRTAEGYARSSSSSSSSSSELAVGEPTRVEPPIKHCPRIVKIDVEGAEYGVITSGLRMLRECPQKPEVFYVEIHQRDHHAARIMDRLGAVVDTTYRPDPLRVETADGTATIKDGVTASGKSGDVTSTANTDAERKAQGGDVTPTANRGKSNTDAERMATTNTDATQYTRQRRAIRPLVHAAKTDNATRSTIGDGKIDGKIGYRPDDGKMGYGPHDVDFFTHWPHRKARENDYHPHLFLAYRNIDNTIALLNRNNYDCFQLIAQSYISLSAEERLKPPSETKLVRALENIKNRLKAKKERGLKELMEKYGFGEKTSKSKDQHRSKAKDKNQSIACYEEKGYPAEEREEEDDEDDEWAGHYSSELEAQFHERWLAKLDEDGMDSSHYESRGNQTANADSEKGTEPEAKSGDSGDTTGRDAENSPDRLAPIDALAPIVIPAKQQADAIREQAEQERKHSTRMGDVIGPEVFDPILVVERRIERVKGFLTDPRHGIHMGNQYFKVPMELYSCINTDVSDAMYEDLVKTKLLRLLPRRLFPPETARFRKTRYGKIR